MTVDHTDETVAGAVDTTRSSNGEAQLEVEDRAGDLGTVPMGRRVCVPRWAIPPAVIVLCALVFGVLGIQGSSLGLYGLSAGESQSEAGILSGPARPIRSDEWLVRTPWVLRQDLKGLPTRVPGGVGEHDVALVGDVPTLGWDLVLRPQGLPYVFLDGARAFALEWWVYLAIQFAGVYALLMVLTRRVGVAIAGAAIMALSPGTQWWTGPGTFTTVGYGCLAGALVLLAYRATKRRCATGLAALAGWSLAAFLASLYVPWQIGVALVLVPVVAAVLVPDLMDREIRRASLRRAAVVMVIAVGLAGVAFGALLIQHKEAVRAITSTVYPGNRAAEVGGGVNLVSLWGAPLDSFSASVTYGVVNGTNQSENSSVVVLILPAGLVAFALASRGTLRGRSAAPVIGGLIGGGVLMAWMLLPLPSYLGHIALLDRVPPSRLLLPFGLAGVIAFAALLTHIQATNQRLAPVVTLTTAGVTAAALLWTAGSYRVDARAINLKLAFLFVAIVTLGIAFALTARWRLGLGILVVFGLWQASLINPLQHGIAPLANNDLSQLVHDLQPHLPNDAGWLSLGGDPFIVGTLTASGVNSLEAISPYPDEKAWEFLDPTSASKQIWNRYAHVSFAPGVPGQAPAFTLNGPDSVTVAVDVCDPRLDMLHVEVIVTKNYELASPCTAVVAETRLGSSTIRIFSRKPTS